MAVIGRTYPGRVVKAAVAALYSESEPYPLTARVERLTLDLAGLPGTRHHGHVRAAGAREPWYRRGMSMRSGRQLSAVSVEELAAVAADMGLAAIDPAWIGANIVTQGLEDLSWLPAGTRIFASSGAALVVEGQNAPCRIAGRAIASNLAPAAREGVETAFPAAARGRRGVVLTVERAGDISAADTLSVKVPPQRLWGVS